MSGNRMKHISVFKKLKSSFLPTLAPPVICDSTAVWQLRHDSCQEINLAINPQTLLFSAWFSSPSVVRSICLKSWTDGRELKWWGRMGIGSALCWQNAGRAIAWDALWNRAFLPTYLPSRILLFSFLECQKNLFLLNSYSNPPFPKNDEKCFLPLHCLPY